MRRVRARQIGTKSQLRTGTFTGRVWSDEIIVDAEAAYRVSTILFEPGARTHWHRHGAGQILQIVAGEGLFANRSGSGGAMSGGDFIDVKAGEEHWHGASEDSYMVHLSISLGATEWLEPVAPEDYSRARTFDVDEA